MESKVKNKKITNRN